MKKLLLPALLILNLTVFSQVPNIKFGVISSEEIKQKTYAIDTSAEAVVFYEKSDVSFGYDDNYGFYIDSYLHIRKKVLKKSGMDRGEIVIPFYRSSAGKEQYITDIDGATYNIENGSLVKNDLKKQSIFSEKITNTNYKIKVSMPNVREGSIIEYKYKKRSFLSVKDKPDTWYFQGNDPTLWSIYDITIPSYLYYQMISGGYLPLNINTQETVSINMGHSKLNASGLHYIFGVKDAPAFKKEPYLTSREDYISKIEFELSQTMIPEQLTKIYSTTWPDLDNTLNQHEYFGKRLKKQKYLSDLVDAFKVIADKKERLQKVYDYMARNFSADDGYNSIYAEDLKKVFTNKKGSPTELNLMLVALLRELDFNANPVITSTRDNGRINEFFPLIDRFNYTYCQVNLNDEIINLDLSSPFLYFGMIPEHCLNSTGRIITEKGGEFVKIAPTHRYNTLEEFKVELLPMANKAKGTYNISGGGYYAADIRTDFFKKGEKTYNENLISDNSELKISKLVNEKMDDKNEAIKTNFEFEYEDGGIMEDMIYLNPNLKGRYKTNPFKLEERKYPVDFAYSQDHTYKCEIAIPKGFEVVSLPASMSTIISGKAASFVYNCVKDESKNSIMVVSRLVIKDPIISPDLYPDLKLFFDKVVNKQDEQIVLKHK